MAVLTSQVLTTRRHRKGAVTAHIRRHPLISFFVLAYLGSWLAWSPWWLSRSGLGVLPLQLPFSAITGINQLGLFAGPFAAALIVSRVADGREGLRLLLRRVTQWRADPLWYVLALVAIPLAAALCYLFLSADALTFPGEIGGVGLLLASYIIYLLGGPLQEEPGWRGFALPRLQERLHPVAAALALGVVHCFWHAPLFLTAEWDTPRQGPGQFLAYLVMVVSMSFVLSWLANGSGGSVMLAILGHNSINWALLTVGELIGEPVANTWPAAVGLSVLALIAIIGTRGRLGLPRRVSRSGATSPAAAP